MQKNANEINRTRKRDNKAKKHSFQKIAERRISTLFEQAQKLYVHSPKYADNCVRLARKISLKHKVSFTREQKMKFCKKCESYLLPGENSRIRASDGKMIVFCKNCKTFFRYMYK